MIRYVIDLIITLFVLVAVISALVIIIGLYTGGITCTRDVRSSSTVTTCTIISGK